MQQFKDELKQLNFLMSISEEMIKENYKHCLLFEPPEKLMQQLDQSNFNLLINLRLHAL